MAKAVFPSLQHLYVYNIVHTKIMLREHCCHKVEC